MNLLESFGSHYPHAIDVLGTLGTWAAVVVALSASYLAKRQALPRIRAEVSVRCLVYGDGRPRERWPEYVVLKLTNVGAIPVRVNSHMFSWSVRNRSGVWLVNNVDYSGDTHVPRRQYPLVMPPRTSEIIYLSSLERFKEAIPKILPQSRLPAFLLKSFFGGVVFTDDGSRFAVSIHESIWGEIAASRGFDGQETAVSSSKTQAL
ncbi:hypothetical protein [Acidocella sp. KAb 2-4]|uniref:hypothetical protein n=1 Tax=Acidocella sp. KAb 2-4 TaxID=2885158 RepID=UPI001D062F54|nr:hypothetical protein [Acidocella sp. KAb 2-4]MCB5943693.1 hypothetical protein [Acidocella sp. KAb 2-4]